MTDTPLPRPEDLDADQLRRFVHDIIHRTWTHYGLWFQQAEFQLEPGRAMAADDRAYAKSFALGMKRLGKVFGFEIDEASGLPLAMLRMGRAELLEAARELAAWWYADDGVWFQEVEAMYDMDMAKRLNDTVWARYSPYEARRIKIMLGLGERSGLDGLEAALKMRTATLINGYGYHRPDAATLVVSVDQCRIQFARSRGGLPDYPCKSAGMVEFSYFAHAIDERVQVRCLACPPDEHPAEWFCRWEFTI